MTTKTNSRRKWRMRIRPTRKTWTNGERSTMCPKASKSRRDPSPRRTRRRKMTMMSLIPNPRNRRAIARRSHPPRSPRKRRKRRRTRRGTRKIRKRRIKNRKIKVKAKIKNDLAYTHFHQCRVYD